MRKIKAGIFKVNSNIKNNIKNLELHVLIDDVKQTLKINYYGVYLIDQNGDYELYSCQSIIGFEKIDDSLNCLNLVTSQRITYDKKTDNVCMFRKKIEFISLSDVDKCLSSYRFYLIRPPCKEIFVIINPNSGIGNAKSIYNQYVNPLLLAAGYKPNTYETKLPLDATNIITNMDVNNLDAIVSVGGDGLLHEIVDGLLKNKNPNAVLTSLMVIPGGSSNGIASSIAYKQKCNIKISSICNLLVTALVNGKTINSDIVLLKQPVNQDCLPVFTPLVQSLSLGLVSDIDIESEYYKFLGKLRFDICAFFKIFRNKCRKVKLHYRPLTVEKSEIELQNGTEFIPPSGWITIEEPMSFVWIMNVTHAGENMIPTPKCKFDSGTVQILYVPQCSFLSLISNFLSINNPEAILSCAKIVETSEFVIIPCDNDGIMCVDGEALGWGDSNYLGQKKGEINYDITHGQIQKSFLRLVG
jgi:diacylglycerol kinase family enzyme